MSAIIAGRDLVQPPPPPCFGSLFAYCKRSKTGAGKGLGTRLSYGVCFVIVTVRLWYSRFRKAEAGLGLDWGCLVSCTDILELML